jgi:hypothetical protein
MRTGESNRGPDMVMFGVPPPVTSATTTKPPPAGQLDGKVIVIAPVFTR